MRERLLIAFIPCNIITEKRLNAKVSIRGLAKFAKTLCFIRPEKVFSEPV